MFSPTVLAQADGSARDGQGRVVAIENAITTLDGLLAQAPPANLSMVEQSEWDAVTGWITTSRDRLSQLAGRAGDSDRG